jgi:hypothetical protein
MIPLRKPSTVVLEGVPLIEGTATALTRTGRSSRQSERRAGARGRRLLRRERSARRDGGDRRRGLGTLRRKSRTTVWSEVPRERSLSLQLSARCGAPPLVRGWRDRRRRLSTTASQTSHLMDALVSIGLPVRNGERYVAGAIESALRQTFVDFELIVSDNASTDATESICRSFARQDSRVRYERSAEDRGAAGNHNRCFELSGGRYFMWLSYDDLLG